MNIINIVKNAPEGAERYKVFYGGHHTEYYAIINGVKSFYNTDDGSWVSDLASYYDSSLPLPKLKTEWVKVEDSIFDPQLQVDFESGILYMLDSDCAYKELRANEMFLMASLVTGSLYRKVEKIVDWRDEVNTFIHCKKISHLGYEINDVCMSDECFLEMCRVALRANGEL